MSYFTEILPATRKTDAGRSNIMGVTGLSRAALAGLFRERGLFGRESSLVAAEQALLQSRLGSIPGLAPRPATTWLTPRLRALAAYADARIAGLEGSAERSRLACEGLPEAAIREVERVIDHVALVFGPRVVVADFQAEPAVRPEYAAVA